MILGGLELCSEMPELGINVSYSEREQIKVSRTTAEVKYYIPPW